RSCGGTVGERGSEWRTTGTSTGSRSSGRATGRSPGSSSSNSRAVRTKRGSASRGPAGGARQSVAPRLRGPGRVARRGGPEPPRLSLGRLDGLPISRYAGDMRRFKWIEWNLQKIAAHALSAEEVEAAFDRIVRLEERGDGSFRMLAEVPSGRRVWV